MSLHEACLSGPRSAPHGGLLAREDFPEPVGCDDQAEVVGGDGHVAYVRRAHHPDRLGLAVAYRPGKKTRRRRRRGERRVNESSSTSHATGGQTTFS